jgi:hypothetical protein
MNRHEFLEKARQIHGFKYIYPTLLPKFVSNDKIDILYKDVLYTQTVSKHLMGRCPEKNTPKKTNEEFISEARKIWDDKYDYSLVEYIGALKKVKIIYDGIIYEQIAISHLSGQAVEFQMNQESFIKKAKDKWGSKYNYSLVNYTNCYEKVKIILNSTGDVFEQSPFNHLLYSPENKSEKKNTNKFIDESNKIHNNKYDYSKVVYTKSSEKVTIICPEHGDFQQVANSHILGMGCKKCGDKYKDREYTKKYCTKEFIESATNRWGKKYDYSLVEYVNGRTKIKVIYDGIIYEQMPEIHLKHPPEGFLNQEIFITRSKKKWGDKYDYSLVEFKSTKHKVKIIFDGKIYEQYPHNHFIYAPELRNKLTLEEFITTSKEVHGNKYSYNKSIYTNSTTKLIITCPLHGDFLQSPLIHLNGSGCKKCKESLGERKISKFLEENDIQYENEKIFENCRNISYLRFDFYIPSKRTIIEFDGIQHFQPVEHFGGIKAYEQLKQNDKIKNEYCEENYINLIRIRYDQIDRIEEILKNNILKNPL